MPPTPQPHKANRRGCIGLAIVMSLLLLAIVAIGEGWLGMIDRKKTTDLPVVDGNGG